jgi:magnesium-transporting ATPase (P-type)
MLTGDKQETAENIGLSCKLFTQKTHIFRMADNETYKIREKLNAMHNLFNKNERPSIPVEDED